MDDRAYREQQALRRVAELAVSGLAPNEVLGAVANEAATLLGHRGVALVRFEDDDRAATVVASNDGQPPIGMRFALGSDGICARILSSGNSARIDDYAAIVDRGLAAELNLRAGIGVPIAIHGRLWGVLGVVSADEPLPAGAEDELAEFADFASVAISSAQSRDDLRQLADEQSALLRVAELVARGVDETHLFEAVANEAAGLIDGEGANLVRFDSPRSFTIVATCNGPAPVGLTVEVPEDDRGTVGEVLRTWKPARRDDYQIWAGPSFSRTDFGRGSSVSVPIIFDGRLWGMLGTLTEERRLPTGTEARLQKFAELVAAALANSQARAKVEQLADEQAALRRVAELVARGVSEDTLFNAVAIEAAGLIDNEATTLIRYEGQRTFTIVATCNGPAPVGLRVVVPLDDHGTMDALLRTHQASRRDVYPESAPLFSRDSFGVGSSVSVPIMVDGELWGGLGSLTEGRPLPAGTEERLQQFAELVTAALANSQARADLVRLADEQAALRRVAELVAQGSSLEEVFDGISVEASHLLGDRATTLMHYEPAGFATVVAACNSPAPLGLRMALDTQADIGREFFAGRALRVNSFRGTSLVDVATQLGVGAGVAVPISVENRLWGALLMSTPDSLPPARSEDRLEEFAAIAAAAIANAENKANLTASRARVVATADETRQRLQRDVHDGAQQWLVQTVLALQLARNAAARSAAATDFIDEALRYAERATTSLRELAHGILPASLSRDGLRTGLESLIADIPTPVSLHLDVARLPAETEITAYFIVAEALTNVVKHAQASSAVVRIEAAAGLLSIDITDDGVGGANPALGSGLTGLLDRVEAAEGLLDVDSPPGAGTHLHVTLPVANP